MPISPATNHNPMFNEASDTDTKQQLRSIALTLAKTTKATFETRLDEWHTEHGDWLKERHLDPKTGRTRYQHERTRGAYFSLVRNIDYLFTFQNKRLLKEGIKMPNTTNPLDGQFDVWKKRINKHPGASKQRIITMLFSFFYEVTDYKKHTIWLLTQETIIIMPIIPYKKRAI